MSIFWIKSNFKGLNYKMFGQPSCFVTLAGMRFSILTPIQHNTIFPYFSIMSRQMEVQKDISWHYHMDKKIYMRPFKINGIMHSKFTSSEFIVRI